MRVQPSAHIVDLQTLLEPLTLDPVAYLALKLI